MPEKLGNGGHGPEDYDANNGQYVEDGVPNKSYDNPDEEILGSIGLELNDIEEDEDDFSWLDDMSDEEWNEIMNEDIGLELNDYEEEKQISDYVEKTKELKSKEDTIFFRQKGKELIWDNNKIKKMYEEHSDIFNEDYHNGLTTFISPQEFLSLTLEQDNEYFLEEVRPLDLNELLSNKVLSLEIDMKTGKVLGQEGRHRMFALMDAGYTKVQILIEPRNYNKHNDYIPEKIFSIEGINGNASVNLINVIPLSKKNKTTFKFTKDDIYNLKKTGNLENYNIEEIELEPLIKQLGLDNSQHSVFSRRMETWGSQPSKYIFDRDKMNYYSPIRLRGGNGNYRVIDGNHRLWALYNSGFKKADVLVEKENKEQNEAMKYFNGGS